MEKLILTSDGYCKDCNYSRNCFDCNVTRELLKIRTRALKILDNTKKQNNYIAPPIEIKQQPRCGDCGGIADYNGNLCKSCYSKYKLRGEM